MRKKVIALVGLVIVVVAVLLATRAGQTPPPEVLRRDLELREGVLYLHGAKQPFTGLLVEDFSKGVRKLEINVRQGRVDGLSRGWFEAGGHRAVDAKGGGMEHGQMEVEETLVAGVSHGLRTRWHPNGQKKSEEHIEHGVVTGGYVEWHDNGQKAVEMTLRGGSPDGLAEAWHPDGTLKSQTRFEGGKIVKREFFPAASGANKTIWEVVQK